MAIGEIKTRISEFFGQGDNITPLAAISVPVPFTYKPSPVSIDIEKLKQCAESYRELKKVSTQVTWFAALRLAGAAATIFSIPLPSYYVDKRDILRGCGSIVELILLFTFSDWASRHYQKAARHEEDLIALYNANCVEAPAPSPVPTEATDTPHQRVITTDFHPEIYGVRAEDAARRHSAWGLFAHDLNHSVNSGIYYAQKHPGKAALGIAAGIIVGGILVAQPELAPLLAL